MLPLALYNTNIDGSNLCRRKTTLTSKQTLMQLDDYIPLRLHQGFKLATPKQTRFGEIQKIRTRKQGIFKLIMATKDANISTVSVQCRMMSSTADFQLYEGTQIQILDLKRAPIIDYFDRTRIDQIYHSVMTSDKKLLTMKVYPFSSFRDDVLKQAISEVNIYQQLANGPLHDWYIMSRGKANSIVMLFRDYQTNLLQIVNYRKQAQRSYLQWQIALIWKGLIANYRQLFNSGFVHRDIRLSKIFFNPANKAQPYQFANLQSARKIQNQSKQPQEMLLTVRGVDIVACEPMRQKIEKGQTVGLYNPVQYDLSCLAQVLLALINLDPLQQETRCSHQTFSRVIRELKKDNPGNVSFGDIDNWLSAILRQYQGQIGSGGLVQDGYISRRLSQLQLRRIYRNQIDYMHLQSLLCLHQKKQFNAFLMDSINENDSLDDKMANVQLLQRVGYYYEQVGLPNNEYYQEEVNTLLDLTKQARQQYFYQDFQEHLEHSRKLQSKCQGQQQAKVRLQLQTTYAYIIDQQIDKANQQLSVLLDTSQRMNSPDIMLQLEVLQLKILLQIMNAKFDTAQTTMDRISLLLANQSKFPLLSQVRQAKASLSYLKAFHYIQLMQQDSSQIRPKTIGLAQESLRTAVEIRSNLPETDTNTIRIVEARMLNAQLMSLREQHQSSRDSLEKANILLQNIKNQQKHNVSSILRLKVLNKLKEAYQKQNNVGEMYASVVKKIREVSNRKQESNSERYSRIRRSNKMSSMEKTFEVPQSYIIREEPQESEVQEMAKSRSSKMK